MGVEQLGQFLYTQGAVPLGQDTLRLGDFATVKPRQRVCDLGCGAGILPLLLLQREPTLTATGIEIEADQGAIARENLSANGLAGEIIVGDLRQVAVDLPPGSFDLVISNPPWFPEGAGRSGGGARMEHTCTLEELCAAAGRLVKNGGRFALVHRPERLADIFFQMKRFNMEPKRLQFVQHTQGHAPSACLVEGVKQGRGGLEVLPALICNHLPGLV